MLEKPTAFYVARRTRKARGQEYAKNVLQTTLSLRVFVPLFYTNELSESANLKTLPIGWVEILTAPVS